MVSPNLHAMLTVVVEVESGRRSGPEDSSSPTLLVGPTNLRLLQPGTLETQVDGRCVCGGGKGTGEGKGSGAGSAGEDGNITIDPSPAHRNKASPLTESWALMLLRAPESVDCACVSLQEAEQELLARVQSALGSVGRGYSVALLLRGRETEAPRLVPQLLQIVFEEALPLSCSDPVLSTLSLVQFSPSGRTQDLLSSGMENLSVLDVAPLGLVVEDATEVEVSDSKAASELYLQTTVGEGRTCCLLTLIVFCPGPDPPEGPRTQGVWRGALRILQLPGAPDCPLLRVLAGEVVGEEAEGSLPWIVSQLLGGNNYSGLLLRLDPQGSSLSLLQAALLGASRRRMQVKQVRPTLWDAVEEARARRAGLRPLRLGLLEDTLTYSGLSQLGRALQELEVVKAWSQHPRRKMLQGARTEAMRLPEPQVIESPVSQSPCLEGEPQVAGRTATLRCGLHQKNPLRHPKEQQVPDVALQFFLAQARRQRLREQHQIWIREKLKHLEQKEEVADDQIKDLVTEEEVFRAWQGQWEERAMTTEHRHCSLLAGILEEAINLATQNQELLAQNQQLRQGAD
ncbi:uncharacterized protein [Macaca nemestrina]|uniref:uncharacterized protein n=1 Tax=Macaca nemestrina TaxID=9545 RepID=UPI0039B89F06